MKNWKKIVAFIMVVVIVLSNTGISANRYVRAEEKAITTESNEDIEATEQGMTSEQQVTSSNNEPKDEKKEVITSEEVTTESDKKESETSEETATKIPAIDINIMRPEVRSNIASQTTTQSDSEQATTSEQSTTQNTLTDSTTEPQKPTIVINEIAISTYKELKVGTEIEIKATDCDENWTVKIYDNNIEQKMTEKVGDNEVEKPRVLLNGTKYHIKSGPTKIEFYNGTTLDDTLTTIINSFSEYTYKAKLGDNLYDITEQDITFDESDSNKVKAIKGFTMQETLPTITKTNMQSVIEIPVETIIKPTIEAEKNNYNIDEELKIIVKNMNNVNMALWECKYSLNGGTAQNINVSNNEYKCKLSSNGKYDFYFTTKKGDKSNTISTTVYNIVEFNDNNTDKWNLTIDNKIYYTNQKKIELQCPLKSSDLKVNGSNDNASFAGYRLVLGAEILSEEDYNVGDTRRTIKITSAKVTKEGIEQSYYQMKGINGQTIKLGFTITKTDLLVKPDLVVLSYRANAMRMDKSDYSLSQVIGTEVKELDKDIYDSLEEAVKNAMDMPTTENVKTVDNKKVVTYSIKNVTKETDGYYQFTQNKNYNLLFEINEFNKGETVAETIDPSEIKEAITLAQFGKNLYLDGATPIEETENQEGNMVGGAAITPSVDDSPFAGHYDKFYFRKHSGQVADITSITEEGLLGALCPQIGNEDIVYYDIILSDTAGLYPTVAAVVRIVKVTEAEKYTDILQKNIVSNGTEYYTINLFYNNEPTTVDFEKNDLDINGNFVSKEAAAFDPGEKIVFTIRGANEDRDVKCGFINLDVLTFYNVNDIKNIKLGTLQKDYGLKLSDALTSTKNETLNDDEVLETYEYPAPDTEGNYLLYVYVTNSQEVSEAHISNGLVIDTTAPTITTAFYDGNNVKFDCPTEKKDRKYLPNRRATMDIVLKDKHTCEAEFTVTVTDKDGKQLPSQEEYYLLKTDPYIPEEEGADGVGVRKTYRLVFNKNANYSVRVDAKDFSGNHSDTATYYLTVDNEKPTGTILVNGFGKENMWTSLMNAITYKLFNKKTATFELEGEDRVSPITCYYYIAEEIDEPLKEKDFTENDDIKWEEYKGKVTIPADKREVVYGKIVDKAGNTTYISTDGLLTDTKAPIVTYTADKETNEKGFYKDDVTYKVKVEEISNVADGSISGLQKISYKILSDNKTTKEETIYENKSETIGTNDREFKIPVKAADNNNNDVKIMIEVTDMAGNEVKESIKLQIDDKPPTIDVTYDNNNIINGKYYNEKRTATITIKERNLDVKNDVTMYARGKDGRVVKIPQLTKPENAGESDDAEYTSTFTFAEDDDYEFFINCTDKAGNKVNDPWKDEFTLDTTAPTIDVSYSGGTVEEDGYYKDAVTATITITEHNFDASKADINITQPDGTSVGASNFHSDGDKHTASVAFNQDGTYSLDVAFTDEAGNDATSHEGSTFHVDLKEPVIEIANVKDKSANKGDVKPVITCTDENYDKNKVTISVKGANSGDINLEKLGLATKAIANGEEFSLTFPKEEAMDDIYTLTAKMEDKAGNEKEESVQFSVNRYGSVYTLADETGEWLTNGVCSYIQEGRDVVIIETNVDEVVERNIAYTSGGIDAETVEVKELEDCSSEEKSQGTYFKTRKLSSGNDWYQYQYTIESDNFANEGRYSVQIDSKDKAGNHTSNASNKHNDSNLDIQFAVDQTAPSAVVTGTDNGGIYEEESRTVMLDVQDNMALKEVTVFLNGDAYATYDAEQIAKLDDGLIPVKVEESFTTQTIQLKATDMAGNVLGEDADGTYDKTFEDFNLIVTQNIVVQMLYTYWLAILAGIAGVTGIIVFLVVRRKKRA